MYPTGDGYLNPTIKALISNLQQQPGGGGDTPVDLSGYVTTTALNTALSSIQDTVDGIDGVSDTSVKGWIRGTGLFRPIYKAFGDFDLTDAQWQSWTLVPYLSGTPVTITVKEPTGTLGTDMVPFVDPGVTKLDPPAGAWTLIVNPNNTAVVTLAFPDPIPTITGRNADGSYLTGSTGATFTIGQGHMALLMYIGSGTKQYYLCII